jgi:hypothetical protein
VIELPQATWGGTGAACQPRVVVLAVCLAAAALGSAASPAAAHGDGLLVRGSLTLAPGEVAAYHGSVHYHRLVARVVADGPVRVRLHDFVTGEVALEVGPTLRLAVNELIACCDDATWTPYTLEIENVGDRPVALRARAVLVHDDLAVMVHGAESGTREGAVFITAAWIVLLWWGRRRPGRASALRRAGRASAVLAAGAVIAGAYGWLAYGRSGAAGLVAGLSHVPVLPWNPLVSRVSLFLGVPSSGGSWPGRSGPARDLRRGRRPGPVSGWAWEPASSGWPARSWWSTGCCRCRWGWPRAWSSRWPWSWRPAGAPPGPHRAASGWRER